MHGFNDADAAREWLARSATATPESAWVCNETGAVQAEWSAVCTDSKRFGTLEWRAPHHLVPAVPSVLEGKSGGDDRHLTLATENTVPAAASAPVIVDAVAETVEPAATDTSLKAAS